MKITRLILFLGLLLAVPVFLPQKAQAVSVTTPTADNFVASVPGATWGGSGITPSGAALSTYQGVTMALTAHGRYSNPNPTTDGAGTFFATPGANYGDPTLATTPSSTLGATWNFAWNVIGSLIGYDLRLYYDFDPAVGNSQAGYINVSSLLVNDQDSQNQLFSFLQAGTPNGTLAASLGMVVQPGGSFNPNADGDYGFALVLSKDGVEKKSESIVVRVGNGATSTPDGGSTGLMLAGSLGFVGFASRKRRGSTSV